MIRTRTLLAFILFGQMIWVTCTHGHEETIQQDASFVLHADNLTAKISASDGRITSLAVHGRELLVNPGEMRIQVGKDAPVSFGKNFENFAVTQQEGIVIAEGRDAKSGIAVRVEWIAERDLQCRVKLINSKEPRLEAAVVLHLPCNQQKLRILAPAGDDHMTVDFSQPLGFGFRGRGRGLVIPAVSFYHPEKDWGITCFADLKLPTRGFELKFGDKPPSITASRVHLRLEPGKPVTVSIVLFGHKGDWRPGLGRILERYPEFFVVADHRIPQLHGAFVCSGGTPSEHTIASWKRQHVQTVEIHCTLPFYGRHLPLSERWTVFADDRWHRLREKPDPEKPTEDASWKVIHAYVTRKHPPNISVAEINAYIRRLHDKGIYALMYFNPTEAWKPWALENYASDLVRKADGKCVPVWHESCLMCPDPDSPWGKNLLAEFEKMMDLYPEADGFFFDQSCYDMLDYAHDDGLSIQNGRTAYRMGWAINQISERCRKMAKARGKFMWWNGPYNIDIARFAEGMMAEAGNESQVRRIQYLTIGGRASCTLSRKDESTLRNCAAYGIYPTSMHNDEMRRLAARYWPVFEMFRGKRWVLTAHALQLPDGARGNIYRLPDGNVLVVTASMDRSIDSGLFDSDSRLTVRLPDAEQFRAAYFISPDLLGKRRLPLQRDGKTFHISIPRHCSVSTILLAKAGVHVALDAPFNIVAERSVEAAAVVDNWTNKTVAGRWTLPAWKDEPIQVAPGASVRRTFRVEASVGYQDMRKAVAWNARLDDKDYNSNFEFYADKPSKVNSQ